MADVIWEALQPRARERILGRAPAVVERFQWKTAAQQTLHIYERFARAKKKA